MLDVTALVRQHAAFVWRTLRRLGLSPSDADDASQEVFLVASRRLGVIQAGRERSFLCATALRVASTFRRTRRRRSEEPAGQLDELAAGAPDPETLVCARSDREELDRVLDAIDDDARAVFVLFELEELPVAEIAELLSLPAGTVASRLQRAREAFHKAVRRRQARGNFRGTR